MSAEKPRRTRADQRRETEARILAAARATFAELGYERTTIRGVASAAGVNAGLVMHYFGSKEELFSRAARLPEDDLPAGHPAEALLTSLRRRLDDEPVASLVVLRSVLTHAEASGEFRVAAAAWLDRIGAAVPAGDAALRAGLISSIITGVVIERHLLKLSAVADASADDIVALMRPVFESLAGEGRGTG
ncbi:TetR/AcrR family transcriptional regulator [Nonomuraea rhizosphaerae]|uniref:TetR/AcrR family transcriptional regulator n=1 Tax=Nonomuraea rhizosphaerae TaxID=2665663 RepID=UPI001C5D97A7|nr:TetR/AcrR family transcriptional regulator [Nonomuraea rhizosphaerae]